MSHSWFIYTTVAPTVAERAVEAMYATLAGIVGEDLAEHLDPGEELEPPALGYWPAISVAASTPVPSADELRASLAEGGKKNAKLDEAALERLAKCRATIQIDRPQRFDPALVSALRALFEKLGPSLFTKGPGTDLSTSESLLTSLAASTDLPAKLRAVEDGEVDGDDEDDDDEDDEDDDEDEDEDEDEPAPDSARPEVLRTVLGAISQVPRARRKASELLGAAPPLVGKVAERLARIGAEPDATVAQALGVDAPEVVAARKALATILRRAESR